MEEQTIQWPIEDKKRGTSESKEIGKPNILKVFGIKATKLHSQNRLRSHMSEGGEP
jgi:hypothetical protein